MSDIQQLQDFAQNILQEVIARGDAAEDGAMRVDTLTEILMEHLSEFGEIVDARPVSFEGRGAKCNGYALSEDGDRLDIFITVPRLDGQAGAVSTTDVRKALERLKGFLEKSLEGLHKTKEEASDSWDMLEAIHSARADLSQARLFLLTDGVISIETQKPERLNDIDLTYSLWDLRRIYRASSSGKGHEPIRVDFGTLSDTPVRGLMSAPPEGGYRSFLTIVPGELLVTMYQEFGPRLLERNVRSFLQLKGKVNQGIRKTILDEPEMFLAYNNGLSVTASGVKVRELGNGIVEILGAEDIQIVNGGQTTGSIFRAARKDKADISTLSVPVKITEILSGADVETIAPRISQSANAQNKVNIADFSSNHRFHRKLEVLSRSVWAPPPAGGGQRQSRWFFERARGQYNDELAKNVTAAQRSAWESLHPRRQLITKTDLAKFEHSWSQLPHIVSKGAEKAYLDFMDRFESGGGVEPDEQYFHSLVALAILFRETDRIVMSHKFGGYKANITTYTVSLLSHLTSRRLNLEEIWTAQALEEGPLRSFIDKLCVRVHQFILKSAGSQNVTEWCKSEDSWKAVKELDIRLDTEVEAKLITRERRAVGDTLQLTGEQNALIKEVSTVSSETWFAISAWAKDTNTFAPWQRGLAYSLGNLAQKGAAPSIKQATQGQKILLEARRQGFTG